VADEYGLDVQKKAAELEPCAARTEELDVAAQASFNGSQTANEESAFMASADELTAKFATASGTEVRNASDAAPATIRNVTSPAGPRPPG
jgi:hypothetical protein